MHILRSSAIIQLELAMNLTSQIPEITRRIIETSHPERIILFGSYARGNFNADSDLDLLVIISGVRHLRQESIRVRRACANLCRTGHSPAGPL